ncbi:N-acetylmuramoyl-L-alanine amidase, partial [Vibrio scophthalmi]
MRKCIIALVIGHRAGSPGAVHAATGVSEFEYNEDLAYSLEKDLVQAGFEVKVVHRKSYQALPSDINALHPDVILSLHCNSFGT